MSEIGNFPWDDDLVLLTDATADVIRRLWAMGFREAAWGLLDATFEVPFQAAADYAIARSGWLIKEANGVTRERVREVVGRVLGPTFSDPSVAPADLAAALLEAFEGMAEWRAQMIARTETGYATAFGAIDAFKRAGIQKGEISDGTTSDDACARADGQIWTVAKYEANPLEHPNCSRAFIPIVEGVAA